MDISLSVYNYFPKPKEFYLSTPLFLLEYIIATSLSSDRIRFGVKKDINSRMIKIALIVCMAYPNGAPESTCTSLIPSHGANAQSAPSPYTLDTTLTETNIVQVSIRSASVYRGFILVGNEGSGMFTTIPTGAKSSPGVTHTSNSDKSNMTFTWTPPSTFCGNIAFRATVVQTRPVYWTGIVSQTLQVNCTGNRTEMTTTAIPSFQQSDLSATGSFCFASFIWPKELKYSLYTLDQLKLAEFENSTL
ncbi:hypothetical protein KUTeg_006924 [Tegillarca granosa]|uniref:Reelin domain-containing protein n=1 Tax=Tegillarca granosa TaxID=220873 RepID=A0ABQ9FBR4_TEGGR|nr:hypothetical protein KUTeg_006924 [Tegillarca granosa]